LAVRAASDGGEDLGQLVLEDLGDLLFLDDERRRQSDRIAGDTQHDAEVVEALFHRIISALAGRSLDRIEIDCRDKAYGADISDMLLALERHGGISPFVLELEGALEQALFL